MELVVRAAKDGIAYRYRLLGAAGERATVLGEESGYRLPDGANAWLAEYDRPSIFTPAYERWFDQVRAGETRDNQGWCYAALFRVPGTSSASSASSAGDASRGETYALISEAVEAASAVTAWSLFSAVRDAALTDFPAVLRRSNRGAPCAPVAPWMMKVMGKVSLSC